MNDLTQEQFQTAVAAAISGVEHLYRQVDLLIARLRERLADEPEPLALKRGTLGKAGKQDSKRVVVRYEYGALFEPAADDPEEDDEEDAEEDDEAEDDEAATGVKGKSKRRPYEIVATQPLLAVRIAMFDPRKKADFEPQVQFAILSDWSLGDAPTQADDRFRLQSYMLRRVARALADRTGPANGLRVRTNAAARQVSGSAKGRSRKLTCSVPAGVRAVPLYLISNAEALEKLAEEMKSMWTSVIGG